MSPCLLCGLQASSYHVPSDRRPVPNRSEAVKAEFAGFELDLASGELGRSGHLVRLQGQPFLVLCVLLDHAREVVTREELQRQLWPDETLVDFYYGLNKAIAKLRDAIDDSKSTADSYRRFRAADTGSRRK